MLTALLVAPLLGAFPQGPKFEPPVRMKAGDDYVRVESPGYASPCWQDVDGDGKKDLVVGQFAGACMRVHRHLNGPHFAAGKLVQAAGETAVVPDIS